MKKFMKIFLNLLTTSRLILSIMLMLFFKNLSQMKILITIIILFLTDLIDGKIARFFQVQTYYGSNMDTISDKTLSIGLTLLIVSKIPILFLPLIGEIIISLINITGKIIGKKTESSNIGKIKTWVIAITIIISYLYYFKKINYQWVLISSITTFVIQIIVIINYIFFLNQQQKSNEGIEKSNQKNLLYRLFNTEYYLKNN